MATRDEPAVEALLTRAAGGDREAAGLAVVAFDERLRRVVRTRLDVRVARRVDEDDVLQETHVEALERLGEYLADRAVPFFVWLRFLALQRCVTLARRHLEAAQRDLRREQPMQAAAPGDDSAAALEGALAASLTSPSMAVARVEVRDAVRRAVQALPPADREILLLRHFEELDNVETASVLSLSTAAASKRYVRALVRLREALAHAGLSSTPPGPIAP